MCIRDRDENERKYLMTHFLDGFRTTLFRQAQFAEFEHIAHRKMQKGCLLYTSMLCEVAAFYKSQGKTLWDGMIDMYEKYGYYREGISTMTLKGIDAVSYTHLDVYKRQHFYRARWLWLQVAVAP